MCLSVVSRLSWADSSQIHSKVALRISEKTRRRECTSKPTTSSQSCANSHRIGFYKNFQRLVKARRAGLLGWSFLKFLKGFVGTELTLSRCRLEKTLADLKPDKLKTDPATHFWTVYKKIADEHDDDLLGKYAGDLDTSLLFVSIFTSLARFVSPQPRSFAVLGGFVLRCRYNFHRPNHSIAPTKPLRPHKRSTASDIATKHFV